MRRGNKILISLVGLLLLLFAVYQVSLLLSIPTISEWSKTLSQYDANCISFLMIFIALIIGLVGLALLLIGIFKPVRLRKFTFHYNVGTLEIPESVIEKNLGYQLVNQYGLIDPKIKVRLYKNHRAKAKVTAIVNEKSNIPKLAEPINQTVDQYLRSRLDIKSVSTSTQLALPDYKQKPRVV